MDGDDCGDGYPTVIGGKSGCADLKPYDVAICSFENSIWPSKVWDLWPKEFWPTIEMIQFPTNWSIQNRFGSDAEFQILQGFQAQSSSAKVRAEGEFRVDWDALPADIQTRVIRQLQYEIAYQLKTVSKSLRDCIECDLFLSSQEWSEGVTLTAPYFFINGGVWHCAGYDTSLKKWRLLPPLTYLPAHCQPDSDLFKEYLVCTKDGIVCANVSKSDEDKLIVFNLLTGRSKELPALIHRRNPVLMHLVVNPATQSFQVIVAGSSRPGDEHLSRMTEVFDSRTWKWKRTGDLPGPDYALNDYQSGVYKDGCILCIAFLDEDLGKGILRYHLEEGAWLKHSTCPIPFARNSTILQLLESWGEVYLFSEQAAAGSIEHCVDRVDWSPCEGVSAWLHNVVRKKKAGGRSLEIYPEYTCVAYSENEVCVVNTIDHSGVIYDVYWPNHGRPEALQAPPAEGKFEGEGFFSLNALSFTLEPSFRSKI